MKNNKHDNTPVRPCLLCCHLAFEKDFTRVETSGHKLFFINNYTIQLLLLVHFSLMLFSGDVGGYMGLMVGASLITFLEFVDFLVVNLIEYCRRNNILSRRKIAISD